MPAGGLDAFAFFQSCSDSFFNTTSRHVRPSSVLKKVGERRQFYLWAIKTVPARLEPSALHRHAGPRTKQHDYANGIAVVSISGRRCIRNRVLGRSQESSDSHEQRCRRSVFDKAPYSPSRGEYTEGFADRKKSSLTANKRRVLGALQSVGGSAGAVIAMGLKNSRRNFGSPVRRWCERLLVLAG